MRAFGHRAASDACLALGLANVAWVDLVLVPRYLDVETIDTPPVRVAAPPVAVAEKSRVPDGSGLPRLKTEDVPTPPVSPTPRPEEREPSVREQVEGKYASRQEPGPELESSSDGAEHGGAHRWKVYFDHGRSELDAGAEQVLRGVVATVCRDGCQGRLQLDGHADPSGSRPFNHRLSERRATSVKAWLLRHGVPSETMEIRAFGELGELPAERGRRVWAARRRVEIDWEVR